MRILLTVTLLFPVMVFAQSGLRMKMETRPEGSRIRLLRFEGEATIPLDSVDYVDAAEVTFRLRRQYPDGLFLLEIGRLESFRFVIANGEMVEAELYESGSGMAFRTRGSMENEAFTQLIGMSQNYSHSMDSLSRAMNSLSDFHPRHDAISDSLANAYHHIAHVYNVSTGLVIDLYPESYAAQVLVPLDRIPLREMRPEWKIGYDNDPAFNHVHFLDFVPWHDERVITSPYLSNKVMDYLYNFTERSEQGVEYAIDRILGHDSIHPKVEAFLVELLVDFFTEKGASEFVAYLHDRYLGSCELPLSDAVKAKIEEAVPIAKGEVMPDIGLPEGGGQPVPLSALQGDINVVVVWSSTCPHCMRELPRLKALYDHLGAQKMNVYAISLDTDREAWVNTVRNEKLNWINVNDLKGWEGPVVEQLGVLGTPAMFLLDHELKLLGRASSFESLQRIVQELVAQ